MAYNQQIIQTYNAPGEQINSTLNYYSCKNLFNSLKIDSTDIFLDIGSGVGNIIFALPLHYSIKKIIGVDINSSRCYIANQILKNLNEKYSKNFDNIEIINSDISLIDITDATKLYMFSTVFSEKLLINISKKINANQTIKSIASCRKVPYLNKFKINKRIFLEATHDTIPIYIYQRVV